VTLAIIVDVARKMLPPMFVIKGAPDSCIVRHKFSSYSECSHYACQKKAWMDNEMMNKWIDLVLVPWSNAKSTEVVPSSFLMYTMSI
jgi:hypothetical protein